MGLIGIHCYHKVLDSITCCYISGMDTGSALILYIIHDDIDQVVSYFCISFFKWFSGNQMKASY